MPRNRVQKDADGHPAFVTGVVRFEFWNNDDEAYRDRALRELAKSSSQAMHISAVPIANTGDAEAGSIAFAAAAANLSQAEALAGEIMKYLDAHAPARLVADNWIAEEIPD